MDHVLDLRPYHGRVHITVRQEYIVNIREGDFVYDARQGYHGKVVKIEPGKGHILIHWFKWDPAIEMPMREHKFSPGTVGKIIFDEEEMLPDEIAALQHKLDLSRYEKGGPYN